MRRYGLKKRQHKTPGHGADCGVCMEVKLGRKGAERASVRDWLRRLLRLAALGGEG